MRDEARVGYSLGVRDVSDENPATATRRPAAAGGRAAGGRMLVVFLVAEAVFLGASVLVLLPFALVDPGLVDEAPLAAGPLLAALAVPITLAALFTALCTRLFGPGVRAGRVRRELAAWWKWRDLGIGLVIGIGGLALSIPAAAIWAAWVGRDQASSAVGEAFAGQQLDIPVAILAFLAVWLLAPFCEEVLFRGALWRALEHWKWNRWVIFLVTSVAFSVAHLELLRTPLLLALSLPIGLARMFTGNVLAAVVAHQVNNFLPALTLLLATTGVVAM